MSINVKLGVTTWLWTSPFTTESIDLFPKIKSMGFEVVELPAEYPERIDGKVVKAALAAHGLEAVVCGAFGPTRDLTHEDPAVHDICFTYIRQCLDLCNVLGANLFVGPMYSAVGKARMVSAEQRKIEWDLAVSNLYKACRMAQECGVSLALEPLNRFESDLVNTVSDVNRLIDDINHPAAGIMLDGFHMSIEEKNMEAAIVAAGSRILHVQVSENDRGIPGSGQTQWESFRKGLDRVNYQGALTIESFTPEIKELAGAVCIWKHLAADQDQFATEGYAFLHQLLKS
jgi:D-psicose/D-tagatose/L-ribulose 3-epimerase